MKQLRPLFVFTKFVESPSFVTFSTFFFSIFDCVLLSCFYVVHHLSSSSSSSANCTAVGHELSSRLPVLYQTSNLFWRWWVCLADYVGNVLMKHHLWATGLTFAMFSVEKGVSVDQFILWFPEDVP